ncbi:hypothetical protein [Vibrio anguillarum]|uniref:hypothetical protein n=1 Tax=Vibrio anguillarum TaxID=55601 RepID=UPI00188C91DF|nr:hypothetical protein [Vibrio anguillarum]MBF4337180.1 hypothetical protein [Vibrio anguillarum]
MKSSNETQTSTLNSIDTTIMPKQVQELIELLGVNEAYQFICQFGGQVKYIAKSPQRTSLKTAVKPENLAVLCAHFGGITLEVPHRQDL